MVASVVERHRGIVKRGEMSLLARSTCGATGAEDWQGRGADNGACEAPTSGRGNRCRGWGEIVGRGERSCGGSSSGGIHISRQGMTEMATRVGIQKGRQTWGPGG